MARCGCGSSCSCLIEAGSGIQVDGIGTVENPYVVSSDATELLDRINFLDSSSVDFTYSGVGTLISPMNVSAVAKLALTDLTDVQGTPADNQVPVWVVDHWEFQDQSGGGGGTGLPSGGTAGQLLIKQSSTDGDALWKTPVTDAVILRTATQQAMASGTEVTMVYDAASSTDPLGMWDGAGTVTVQRAGLYEITANYSFAATAAAGSRITLIRLGGTTVKQWYETYVANQAVFATHTIVVNLAAGTTIQSRQYQSSGASLNTYGAQVATNPSLYVTRLGDSIPGTPLPDPVIGERTYAAIRTQTAIVSAASGAQTPIPFDTQETSDGITWAAGVFTVPVDGYYQVLSCIAFPALAATTSFCQNRLLVNGTTRVVAALPLSPTQATFVVMSRTIQLAAGDTLSVNANHGAGSALSIGGTANNWFSVTKVPAPTVPGRAASGMWPNWGITDNAIQDQGLDIYVDSVGQLRAGPTVIGDSAAFSQSTPGTSYPYGMSVLNVYNGSTGGWPTHQGFTTAVVMTARRSDGAATQWWSSNVGGATGLGVRVMVRQSTGAAWGPWMDAAGLYVPKTARGRTSVPIASGAAQGSIAVSLPAGLFTAMPRIALTVIGTSGYRAFTTSQPSATAVSIGAMTASGAVVGSAVTVAVDWIATEGEY